MTPEVCTPHWTSYVSALLTPLVAAFAVWIAHQQSAIAQNKLRFDLFEKRFLIYEGAHNFLGSIMTSGKVDGGEMYKFVNAIYAAKWIVSQEIADYLDREVYNQALTLQGLESELAGMSTGEDRKKNLAQQSEIKRGLTTQFNEQLDVWFNAYLRLKH